MPLFNFDPAALENFQNSMEVYEGADPEIDLFVDTTQVSRFITIFNTEKIEFDEKDASLLKREFIRQQYKNLNDVAQLGEVESKFKRTINHIFAKYTLPKYYLELDKVTFSTIYFLTGHSYTLVVIEISDVELYVEDYLWTTKT